MYVCMYVYILDDQEKNFLKSFRLLPLSIYLHILMRPMLEHSVTHNSAISLDLLKRI